jgi:hypothetical protein
VRFDGLLKKIEVRPGDAFVLTTSRPFSVEQAAYIRTMWNKVWPDNEIIVLDGSVLKLDQMSKTVPSRAEASHLSMEQWRATVLHHWPFAIFTETVDGTGSAHAQGQTVGAHTTHIQWWLSNSSEPFIPQPKQFYDEKDRS